MLQNNSIIENVDNSGVKTLKVLKLLGGSFCKKTSFNQKLTVSVQKLNKKKKTKISKKNNINAIVTSLKMKKRKENGFCIKYQKNKAVLITNKNSLIGTRIFGPISTNLRNRKQIKLLSIAVFII